MKRKKLFFVPVLCVALFSSCVSPTTRPDLDGEDTPSSLAENTKGGNASTGLKRKVAIARFSNETTYAKGAFYDKANDPLGKQTLDILSAKLAASGKFILLERSDLDAITAERDLQGTDMHEIVGADYLIIGSLTKYGRKNTGEAGIASRRTRQTVEAGVSIRLVDVSTGQIIYSEEANGTAETEASTTFGIGGQAGFERTLNEELHGQNNYQGKEADDVHSGPEGKSQCAGKPQAGCSGKPANIIPCFENNTGTQKAYAAHCLSRDTCSIDAAGPVQITAFGIGKIHEAVF